MQHERILSSIPLTLVLAACTAIGERRISATPEPAGSPASSGAMEAVAIPAAVPLAKAPESFELAFATHLDMELPEQDAYIEREPGSGQLWRVTLGENDMSLPLYRTARAVKHDPFDPAALGPYPKGEPLGMTLGQWLHQSGHGRYTYADGVGKLELSFSGLVPKGVYTLWHAFMALPPTEPFSGTLDLPLGARDGSESVFVADEKGRAEVVRSFTPGLQMSDVYTTSMLAIAYHSDGKTHGGVPGDFGLNVHVPLFVMLPHRDGIQ
jgi:hypothetical protein